MKKDTLHIVGVSGGKDSTATLLLALSRVPKSSIRAVFADTGNEHAETYAYLDYLEERLSIPIHRIHPDFTDTMRSKRRFIARDQRVGRDKRGVKLRWSNKRKREALATMHPSGNAFLDLCMAKGMFPSNLSRFCTEYLKKDVIVGYADDLVQAGYKLIVWQGIRRDESDKRKNARLFNRVGPNLYNFRPLILWTEKDVFAFLKEQNVDPNPMYAKVGRVSCAPCVYSNKKDLRVMLDETTVDRIKDWEKKVSACSKSGWAGYFHGKELAGSHIGEVHPLVFMQRHQIDAIKHWSSKTTRFMEADWDFFETEFSCSSEWGMCS